jgi:hypothetical protein
MSALDEGGKIVRRQTLRGGKRLFGVLTKKFSIIALERRGADVD